MDASNGYENIAGDWSVARSKTIGADVVRAWARDLAAGTAILDLGCGDGVPIAAALTEAGFLVYGVDASPSMIAAFRRRFPEAPAEVCAAEVSSYFERRFDAIVAWGLLFLLPEETQRDLIQRVAKALNPGGRFLFTAPSQAFEWRDGMTGRRSVSLGREEYTRVLEANGLALLGETEDDGQNFYYFARRVPAAAV